MPRGGRGVVSQVFAQPGENRGRGVVLAGACRADRRGAGGVISRLYGYGWVVQMFWSVLYVAEKALQGCAGVLGSLFLFFMRGLLL